MLSVNHVFEKHIECGIKVEGNVMCPGGCNQIINPTKLEPSKFADRMVNTLTTKCMNDNCLWQGDLLDLVQFCRRDIQSHDQTHQANHMKLIYNNLVDCKQELLTSNDKVTVLSQENITMKEENVAIKQDIITMKEENVSLKEECYSLRKEVDKLKMKSKEDLSQLKLELKTMATEFEEFKENIIIKENANVASNEIVDEKQRQIKEGNNIDKLKAKLKASPLYEKVSIINDDKVLKLEDNNKKVDYSDFMQNLSECYKNNQFDWIINRYDLVDHRNIMKELLSQLPYHLFEF